MGEWTLATRIGKPRVVARELIRAHKDRYRKFWKMAEGAADCAMLGLPITTVFGWHARPEDPNPRSSLNFPMQANGAEMMRLAACLATERGLEVCAPVHDAFLICAPLDRIETDVTTMRASMVEASQVVLGGFELATECSDHPAKFPQIIRCPNRYMDKRGAIMWERVMRLVGRRTEEREVA
jgi:DNA polymerase I